MIWGFLKLHHPIMSTFQDTLDFCKKNYQMTHNSRRYKSTDEVIKNLKMEPRFEKTTVEVVNSDSFDYARTLKSDRVMVLNLANDTYAGSTVASSLCGQECINYCKITEQFRQFFLFYYLSNVQCAFLTHPVFDSIQLFYLL